MIEAYAQQKVCPFMSNAISAGAAGPGMLPTTINFESYCVGSRCMSWEGTVGAEQLEGYCKLLEEKQ